MVNKYWIIRRLKNAFGAERVICRLIAAWACFVLLAARGEEFSRLEYAQNTNLLSLAVFVGIVFVLLSVGAFFARPFHTDSWALLLFASGCVGFWLVEYQVAAEKPFFQIAVGIVYCLFLIYCVHANRELLQKWHPGKWTVLGVSVGAGILCCLVISLITCFRHVTFSTPNFDFGLFCNMFHNMAEGGSPMVTSERDQLLSHFAVHISPIYYVLLPFYWLFPSPLTLQIGQAVVLALGVIPVVLLARHFRLSGKVTIIVALMYSFYPAITSGCFYDLHENCFLLPCLLTTFLFYEKKQYIPMYVSALFVLAVKEDAAVYLLFFALFVLLAERQWLHGAILSALALGYFFLCGYLLETYGQGMMVNRFDNLIFDPEDGLLGAIKTALVNPGYLLTQLLSAKGTWNKIQYLFLMILPIGVLPFCTKKPSRWLLLSPLLINLLTDYVYQYDIGFQYHFGITAFLFYALLKNLPELHAPTRQTLLSVGAAFCCCLYIATAIPKMNTYVKRWNENSEMYIEMEEILETVPEDASVVCSTFLLSHIADRAEIYELTYHKYRPDVEYVVFDLRYRDGETYYLQYRLNGYSEVSEKNDYIVILKKDS